MLSIKYLKNSLIAAAALFLSSPAYTAEQQCRMINTQMFDGLLSKVPFKDRTRRELESVRNIQVNDKALTIAGRTRQLDLNNSWTTFVQIRCENNGNNWSPCGEPNAKITLQKVNESRISGKVQIGWEYHSLYPPVFAVDYSCTSQKANKKVIAKKQTTIVQDDIKNVFNSMSLQKRKDIQSALKKDGFYTSSIDGLYGKGTRRAIRNFASENGYSVANERGVTTTLAKVLEATVKQEQKQVVVATTVNVTKTEPKLDSTSTPPTTSPISTIADSKLQKWENAQTIAEAQRYVDEVQATIVMYMAIREVVDEQPPTMKERVLGVVDNEINRLQEQKLRLQDRLTQRFTTPIKPTNANLQVSAFRASDTFPKVPFYIPGTNEIGEMLVTPRVSDDGYLNYQFDFIDPVATYEKVRDSALIPHANVDGLITGMGKIDEWTRVAQENNVNRRLSKTAACIPVGACEVKKAGVSSAELMFQIYEDGSTAGRLQINKGMFSVGYNMSVETTILLQAYLIYMRDLGSKEFNVGVMSDEEVLDLFD